MQSTQTARRATFTNELASVYLRLYKGRSWRRCRAINYSTNCRKVDTPFSGIADSEEKIHRTSNRKEFSLKGSSLQQWLVKFQSPSLQNVRYLSRRVGIAGRAELCQSPKDFVVRTVYSVEALENKESRVLSSSVFNYRTLFVYTQIKR